MIDSVKIGKFILELRKSKSLSQGELGEILGVDRVSISKWERGVSIPSHEMLLKLSTVFEVSINEILRGEKENLDSKKINFNFQYLKHFAMGTILSAFLLVIGNHFYLKSLSTSQDNLQENNTVQVDTTQNDNTIEVTRGLKQVLVNKYGEKITGNPKYDHGAPDRDVLQEEMIPGVRYYRYVYDDSLTEEENQEQFLRLEEEALKEYLERQLGGKMEPLSQENIIDKGISSDEGDYSIMNYYEIHN